MGNDIVDLKRFGAADKSNDHRFVGRVFTAQERKLIQEGDDPDRRLWTIWACKETAYKVAGKINPQVSSAPRNYPVELSVDRGLLGPHAMVNTPCGPVTARIAADDDDLIHVVGVDGFHVPEGVSHGIGSIFSTTRLTGDSIAWARSQLTRRQAVEAIAASLHAAPASLQIVRQRSAGALKPPVLFQDNVQASVDISLSHDGRFGAYAFYISP